MSRNKLILLEKIEKKISSFAFIGKRIQDLSKI